MEPIVIEDLCKTSMEACRLRIDNLTKPLYSLAHLELMAERMAGIYRIKNPNHLRKGMVVFAADHAVNGPQNKTLGKESLKVITVMNDGRSATDALARALQAPVFIVDVGLQENTEHLSNVRQSKVCSGSNFFALGMAMENTVMEEAIETGRLLASELSSQGIQAVGIGNIGERAGLSALAVTAACYDGELKELMMDNECALSVQEKVEQLGAYLSHLNLKKEEPLQILQSLGSPDIAAMVGFILEAASRHMAIVFDNAVTGAAVLVATLINEKVKQYVFTSAVYEEPVHKAQLKMLDMKAFLHYRLTVEEGVGSALGLSLLDASLHMLNDMKTFGEAAVTVAEDGPGSERQDQSVRD